MIFRRLVDGRAVESGQPVSVRGVTIFDGSTATHYPTADSWLLDEKGALHISDADGKAIALFLVGTWLRVEAGAYKPNQ